jgi:phosphohistidine phosphatase
MELILWRHADAEDGASDAVRPLTANGLEQAEKMAKWLRARLPANVVVLSSPALRAQQTAKALGWDYRIEPALGGGSSAEALITATGWPNGEGCVVAVGHQPTLGQVASLLLSGSAVEWSIKKAGVWWLEHRPRGAEVVVRAVISPDLLSPSGMG